VKGGCVPSLCSQYSSENCSDSCVVDVDGSCRQACKDGLLYMVVDRVCQLKPNCSERKSDGSEVYMLLFSY
jgi:hypothetical protein